MQEVKGSTVGRQRDYIQVHPSIDNGHRQTRLDLAIIDITYILFNCMQHQHHQYMININDNMNCRLAWKTGVRHSTPSESQTQNNLRNTRETPGLAFRSHTASFILCQTIENQITKISHTPCMYAHHDTYLYPQTDHQNGLEIYVRRRDSARYGIVRRLVCVRY